VTKKAAIVGAGLAGLSCARTLRRAGFFVEVFEQDRVIGGRVATARIGGDTFDPGAQYVTARSKDFGDYLNEIAGLGYATRWTPRSTLNGSAGTGQMHPWMVGTPGMSAMVRPLVESVRVTTGKRVHTLEKRDKGWHVWFEDETSVGPFHAVAVAVPPSEARLLIGRVQELVEPLSRVRMAPCWALMVRVDEKILPDQDVYSDMSETIRWIARNNTKPGRAKTGESIVIHASPSWSRETEGGDPEEVAQELWGEVSHILSLPPVRPAHMTAHLWRHGLVETSLGETYLYSSEHKAGIAGDWCLGRLAEHAFESGDRLGKAIINSLS
jgi:predicted NAD/FAD-dependent oxidoreductase